MTSTVCFINIGPRERRKRLAFGISLLALALTLATWTIVVDMSRPWRLALLLPFWAGALGVFQAREKT